MNWRPLPPILVPCRSVRDLCIQKTAVFDTAGDAVSAAPPAAFSVNLLLIWMLSLSLSGS